MTLEADGNIPVDVPIDVMETASAWFLRFEEVLRNLFLVSVSLHAFTSDYCAMSEVSLKVSNSSTEGDETWKMFLYLHYFS